MQGNSETVSIAEGYEEVIGEELISYE